MTPYLPIAVAVLVTAILLILEHWIVQHICPERFPDVFRYSIGSAAILVGFALWDGLTEEMRAAGIQVVDMRASAALALVYVGAGGILIMMHLSEQVRAGQGHRARADYMESAHMGDDDDAVH
jgi:hypothetical protein